MRTLGDAPELGTLADYLDFLDVHDLRALGVQAVPPRAPGTAPLAPAPFVAYRPPAQLTRTAAPTQRLVSAMIPAGRALTVPFGSRMPSLLSPGVPVDQSTGLSPSMIAQPAAGPDAQPGTQQTIQGPVQTYQAQLPGAQDQVTATDPGTPPGDPNAGGSASGSSGLVDRSTWGWLLLAAGGYVMWRSL